LPTFCLSLRHDLSAGKPILKITEQRRMDSQTMMDGIFDGNLNTIYGWVMDILSIMNTFSTAIVLFMLLKKTPNEMKPYRWFLLNVAVILLIIGKIK
jgi:hypothetical protein